MVNLGRFSLQANHYNNIYLLQGILVSKHTSLFLSGASRKAADFPNRHPPFSIKSAVLNGLDHLAEISSNNFIKSFRHTKCFTEIQSHRELKI